MLTNALERTCALAGLYQAILLIERKATTPEPLPSQALVPLIDSLFHLDAPDTLAVYGGTLKNLSVGLPALVKLFEAPAEDKRHRQLLHYVFGALFLGTKLNRTPQKRAAVTERIREVQSQYQLLGPEHPQLIKTIADIYSTHLSSLRYRIRIHGQSDLLAQSSTQAMIRTLLLCAVRSGILWRQLGGRQWHFLLKKRALLDSVKELNLLLNQEKEVNSWNSVH